jgi:hypothetical protein
MSTTDADDHLAAHAAAIDDLHKKLAATPGVDGAKLTQAVGKLKESYAQFVEDAKGCMQ